MKKQLSLASKRKWVTGGILAFSAVSLLTTGFATWVVGVQRVKQEDTLTVTVDTASNEFVKLDATLSKKEIRLAEVEAATGPIVTSGAEGGDLSVTFSELKVTIGSNFNFENSYTGIQFQFINKLGEEGVVTTHGTNASGDLINEDDYGASSKVASGRTTYEYIKLWDNITLTNASFTDNGDGTKTWSLDAGEATKSLVYGGFFGGKTSPAKYYNDLITKEIIDACSTAQLATLTKDIADELNAMNEYFTDEEGLNSKLYIRVSLIPKA